MCFYRDEMKTKSAIGGSLGCRAPGRADGAGVLGGARGAELGALPDHSIHAILSIANVYGDVFKITRACPGDFF